MSIEREDSEKFRHSAESEEVEHLYHSVGSVMGRMLMREWGMSEAAVESVLRDVFSNYILSKHAGDDPAAWLTGETVLSFRGRYAEALDFVARSERAFAQVSPATFDVARLALIEASVLGMLNRSREAAMLAREADAHPNVA